MAKIYCFNLCFDVVAGRVDDTKPCAMAYAWQVSDDGGQSWTGGGQKPPDMDPGDQMWFSAIDISSRLNPDSQLDVRIKFAKGLHAKKDQKHFSPLGKVLLSWNKLAPCSQQQVGTNMTGMGVLLTAVEDGDPMTVKNDGDYELAALVTVPGSGPGQRKTFAVDPEMEVGRGGS